MLPAARGQVFRRFRKIRGIRDIRKIRGIRDIRKIRSIREGAQARAGATGHGDRKPVPSQAPGQVRSPQVPPRRAAYFAEKGGLLCREGRLK